MANDLQEKKMDYSFESKNFIIDGELTVTITLSEYRELVSSKATKQAEIDKAEDKKWERDSENKKLKEENAKLKAELYELKKKLDCKTAENNGSSEEDFDGGEY